ncbi:uncharacterized protein LOC127847743 isoform X2 [Dreissena polymorpha]|uniref:uncharacterized protein LOC127847743 isoform X2 n=1 Tax=Dreissena polymorpha TaxID=45954 RepID=UPI002264C3B9|nr:uncharacterized protein LOC127847743 isoform X2 [Dreissena polymorpha]
MLRNIGNVACFTIVLMTSHHVTGQAHDVAQLNRRLTIISNSVEYDIADIRHEVMDLKMIVEQIVGGKRNTSDGSVVGQGITDLNQREITDLNNKLNAHESRLNRLFSTVNEIQVENTSLKNKVHQCFEEKENGDKNEPLKLKSGIETKFDAIVNVLQMKFEETAAAMMKGYKDLKTHVNAKVSAVDQINNLAQSVISEQNKLSTRLDQAVNKLEVNELVEKRERNELINNLKSELLLLNAGVETKFDDRVNALQNRFEESTMANLAGYKYLETHMSVQMKNITQSVISEQNKLSARMDQADEKLVRLDGGVNKLADFSRIIEELKAKTDKCCIDCGDPTPDHGTVNTTETTFGTVVQISCNHGYVLSGENIAKCNADSVWSELATCNPYDCGSAAPANGVAKAPNGTTYQKQATVQCNPEYTLNGSSVIECTATGWNDSVSCVIQKPYGLAKTDLVFIVGASTSVTDANFQKMRDFLKEFLSNADIDSGSIRVGINLYNTEVQIEFHLNRYRTSRDTLAAVDRIPYIKGSANTADALKSMSEVMFSPANGDRPDAPNVCILLTDSVSNINIRRTIPEAVAARAKGIHLYVIGIALQDTREVDAIASPPAADNSFHVETFDQLKGLHKTIFSASCPGMKKCSADEYLVKNDSILSVSSQWDQNEPDKFGADQGRLNSTETGEGTSFRAGIWAAGVADTNQYIQVNFSAPKIITGIETRGRPISQNLQIPQWVTQYRFMYSRDCETFNTYTHTNGSDMPCAVLNVKTEGRVYHLTHVVALMDLMDYVVKTRESVPLMNIWSRMTRLCPFRRNGIKMSPISLGLTRGALIPRKREREHHSEQGYGRQVLQIQISTSR